MSSSASGVFRILGCYSVALDFSHGSLRIQTLLMLMSNQISELQQIYDEVNVHVTSTELKKIIKLK